MKKYLTHFLIKTLSRVDYTFKAPLKIDVWVLVGPDGMDWDCEEISIRHIGKGILNYGPVYPMLRHIGDTKDLLRLFWAYLIRD
ncbi:hypothetical protein Emin_0985 [Elusimicrobium minutum Pei191]|uniref:Uncharacterized protein n=1 Tax=Elusimicrobium minutum (strain Pei191) TaxID=445932 RepID=B2KDE2_ELUMP|nr:hypothetical protein [Elusimicrobium minutum]ACC98538.1 hypothetical protein Emin_0985 [Elusimicrobium minutum Pei191]